MTDVRLTATNPEDSSVVPVACNSRGELLVTEPVIEQIENDVSIDGSLSVLKPSDIWNEVSSFYPVGKEGGSPSIGGLWHNESGSVCIQAGGYRGTDKNWVPFSDAAESSAAQIQVQDDARITFRTESNKARGSAHGIPTRFTISDDGPSAPDLRLERPGDARAWSESISVFEELEFLRAQVRGLLEKLKMTPEGGWEVWDGSAET